MKVVVQRSGYSQVIVDREVVAEIESGLVLLVCFEKGDSIEIIDSAVAKILNLRIFEETNGKMNLNISDISGEILCISQFTLSWDGKNGNRPSFDKSMSPEEARVKFKVLCDKLRNVVPVKIGRFGKKMDVRIQNLGPVTFNLSF